MNRKISVSVALAVTLLAMTITFAITMLVSMDYFNNAVQSVTEMQKSYSKLTDLDSYVRGNYYGEIDDNTLNNRIAQGYLNGIDDKYSTYYTEEEYVEMQEYESGSRVGIGIEVALEADGYFRIVRVYDDSPAQAAGVKTGGRITFVDETDAKTITNVRAMQSLLRGLQGTDLTLTCLYGASEETVFKIQRKNYTAPTVEYMRAGDFGYLRIYSLESETYNDFEYLVNQAVAEGVNGFVFDLRGNQGASFQQAYNMLNLLCPLGTLAKSESKNGTVRVLATSDGTGIDLPMVALVNENTAAAAELFAANIQDLAGGRIVGVNTAGKWMLQSTPQRLTDGSAVSITVAKLLTGNNKNYETVGLTPDVEAISTDEGVTTLYNPDPGNDQVILRALETVRSLVPNTDTQAEPAADSSEANAGSETQSSVKTKDDSSASQG